MKLDYSITNNYNNYMDGGYAKYDYVDSCLILFNQVLVPQLKEKFNVDAKVNVEVKIDKELGNNIYKWLSCTKTLSGIYGDNFLNSWI